MEAMTTRKMNSALLYINLIIDNPRILQNEVKERRIGATLASIGDQLSQQNDSQSKDHSSYKYIPWLMWGAVGAMYIVTLARLIRGVRW